MAAQRFDPRGADGMQVLDLDTLAVYPNLIRNQNLHLYLKTAGSPV